jgi:cyclophilin family peptidyl-prolyl cis-trans isomerase
MRFNLLFIIALIVFTCAAIPNANAAGLTSGAEKLLTVDELGPQEGQVAPVRVNIDTAKGSFVVEVYPGIAPASAENFLRLVNAGYYDGIAVHRVVEGFVMQAGQPSKKQKDREKLDIAFKDEMNYAHHDPGTISFAKLYDTDKKIYIPDSAGAQFFINLGDNRRLDENFTVFGKVVWGMDIVRKIKMGDVITRAYTITGF